MGYDPTIEYKRYEIGRARINHDLDWLLVAVRVLAIGAMGALGALVVFFGT